MSNSVISPEQFPEGGGSYLENGAHVLVIRVYYEDTDAEGLVYYANYLKYAERARTAMLRLGDWGNARLARGEYQGMDKGVSFVMRHFEVNYKRAAVLDDLITVRTHAKSVGGATMELVQIVCRGDEVLVEAQAKLGCIAAETLRPTRIPAALRAYMQGFVAEA